MGDHWNSDRDDEQQGGVAEENRIRGVSNEDDEFEDTEDLEEGDEESEDEETL